MFLSGLRLSEAFRVFKNSESFWRAVLVVLTALPSLACLMGLFLVVEALLITRIELHDHRRLVVAHLADRAGNPVAIPEAFFKPLAPPENGQDSWCPLSTGGMVRTTVEGQTVHRVATQWSGLCQAVFGHSSAAGTLWPDEDVSAGPRVVISARLWKEQFSSHPDLADVAVSIEGAPFRVVGVARTGFSAVGTELPPDLFLPLDFRNYLPGRAPRAAAFHYFVGAVGRDRSSDTILKTLESTRSRVLADGALLDSRTARSVADATIHVDTSGRGLSYLRPLYADTVVVLGALGALLLAVAMVNVSALAISSFRAREREFAARQVLGATRGALVSQLFAESLIPAALSCVLAVPLAIALRDRLFETIWTAAVPVGWELAWGWRPTVALLIAFAIFLAVLAMLPVAVVKPRTDGLRTRGGSSRSPVRLFLGAQVAGGVALSVVGLVLFGSYRSASMTDPGYRTSQLVAARMMPVVPAYAGVNLDEYYRRLLSTLSEAPGVSRVALARAFPRYLPDAVRIDNRDGVTVNASVDSVTPDFFSTVGARLVEGRGFSVSDVAGAAAVAVVSQRFAEAAFGERSAIGRTVFIGSAAEGPFTIVGIVGDLWLDQLGRERETPVVLRAWFQDPTARQPMLLVESRGSSADALRSATMEAIRLGVESTSFPTTIEADRLRIAAPRRTLALLSVVLGGLVLVILFCGVFSVQLASIRSRRAQVAIQIALGAGPASNALVISRDALLGLIFGFVAGVAGGTALATITKSLVYSDGEVSLLMLIPLLVGLAVSIAAVSLAAFAAVRNVDVMEVIRSS